MGGQGERTGSAQSQNHLLTAEIPQDWREAAEKHCRSFHLQLLEGEGGAMVRGGARQRVGGVM